MSLRRRASRGLFLLWFLASLLQAPAALAESPPYGNLLWDGDDPFHQPAATTDYYGSGDIDGNGSVTSADVAMARSMAEGTSPMRITADVDGDGDVDASDVTLLEQALTGATLPASWNQLTTRAQRESWALKIMALDTTNEHTPWTYWFQCGGFSLQMFIHAAYYRGDLYTTYFDGGPTVFNLPMYPVGVFSSNFGHAINGILVGDDPLSFDDWLFLEPQTDEVVLPGMWDMPYDNTVSIHIPYRISRGGAWIEPKIDFYIQKNGWSLQQYSPTLQLVRGNPGPQSLDQRWDQWSPALAPTSTGLLFFQQSRADGARTSDIYVQDLSTCGAPQAPKALTSAPQYSRLLDVYRDTGGEIHLLWEGKADDYVPGVFYGRLSADQSGILEVVRVSEGNRSVRMGRVVVTATGERHVFWLEDKGNFNHPYETGIYWSKRSGSSWLPAQNLASLNFSLFDFSDWWQHRDALRYYFDVAPVSGNHLALAWNEPVAQTSNDFTLKLRNYDGAAWGAPVALGAAGSGGMALGMGGGTMYLVYSGAGTDLVERRGNLAYRTSTDGVNWSAPGLVDTSGKACCPRIASSASEAVLVWDRKVGERGIPVWSRNAGLGWSASQQLDPGAGNEAWFPTVTRLPDGEVVAAWSSRSDTLSSIAIARLAGQNACVGPANNFFTVAPCRLLDTRNSNGPLGGPVLSSGQSRLFTAAGACGIPADADAISVNLTVVGPTALGHLSFYPGNATSPGTSTINFSAGQTRPNNAILRLSTDGSGKFGVQNASTGSSHLIVDVNGYFKQ